MGIWKHFGKSGRRENKIKIYGKNNKICVFEDTEEVPLAEGEGIYGLEISVLGEGNIIGQAVGWLLSATATYLTSGSD